MFGPTPKYGGQDRDPIDGTPMYWHVHPDGYPVREGDAPAVIPGAHLNRAGVQFYARSQVFRIPQDMEAYVRVLDWIANGVAQLRSEDKQPNGDGTWTTWVTWLDVRGYVPPLTGGAHPKKPPPGAPRPAAARPRPPAATLDSFTVPTEGV